MYYFIWYYVQWILPYLSLNANWFANCKSDCREFPIWLAWALPKVWACAKAWACAWDWAAACAWAPAKAASAPPKAASAPPKAPPLKPCTPWTAAPSPWAPPNPCPEWKPWTPLKAWAPPLNAWAWAWACAWAAKAWAAARPPLRKEVSANAPTLSPSSFEAPLKKAPWTTPPAPNWPAPAAKESSIVG